jgi:oxygen-independent coproporphyrinogen III oxidase
LSDSLTGESSGLSSESLVSPGAIYIHIPFCVKKCIYCDFFSKTNLNSIPQYTKAVGSEIKKRSLPWYKISTIYFGGGTPSLLSIKDVDLLLCAIEDNFSILPDAEISFEINPGTVDLKYLAGLKDIGINRLSIGVQSFNDDKLGFLKRIHTSKQAVKAIGDAKKAGFDNISLDMIYGLPFETQSMWLKDLEKAVGMEPAHLSCYMLTIEPLTDLHKYVKRGIVKPLDNNSIALLFRKTSRNLKNFQFEHYEISNFSKGRAKRSKHNSQYWDRTPYYGFGASAHSYDGSKRSWNHKSIEKYIKDLNSSRLPVEDFEILNLKQKKLETIMLRLRTLEGIDLENYKDEFQISFETEFKDIIASIQAESFGFLNREFFALNLEGKTRLDHIVELFAKAV